eukprot:364815-Chlamydomonas_euryale.AAC.15
MCCSETCSSRWAHPPLDKCSGLRVEGVGSFSEKEVCEIEATGGGGTDQPGECSAILSALGMSLQKGCFAVHCVSVSALLCGPRCFLVLCVVCGPPFWLAASGRLAAAADDVATDVASVVATDVASGVATDVADVVATDVASVVATGVADVVATDIADVVATGVADVVATDIADVVATGVAT